MNKKKDGFLAHKCVDLFIFIIGLVTVIILYFTIFKNIIERLRNGIGEEVFWILILICFVFYALSLIVAFFWEYYCFRKNRDRNWMVFWTIFLMIFFLFVGGYLIIHSYGEPQLSLVLRDSNNIRNVVGNITCADADGRLIAGEDIYCETYPVLQNISGKVLFGSRKKMDLSYLLDDDLTFVAPNSTSRIIFLIGGFDDSGKYYDVQVGYDIGFFSPEDLDGRRDKMITYFILLIGAVLFSVPSMMNNFKNLKDE